VLPGAFRFLAFTSDYGLCEGHRDNDRSVINAGINIYRFKTRRFHRQQHRGWPAPS
jgi:hypothetical protein